MILDYRLIYKKLYKENKYFQKRRAIKHAHRRKKVFWLFIKENLLPPATVLDIGCGPAFLLKRLHSNGYTVIGLDIVPELCQQKPFPILDISCEELYKIKEGFDLVVASDILEHLTTEREVFETLKQIQRLTKQFFIISVGIKGDQDPLLIKEDGTQIYLHNVVRSSNWWYNTVEQYGDIIDSFQLFSSFVIYGAKQI